MNTDPIPQRIALQLRQNWGVECDDFLATERIRLALRAQIEWMIGHELERLVQAMYRLDIPEGRFHQAMQNSSDPQKAEALTDLVMERERQRAETWVRYSGSSKGNHD